MKDRMRAKIRKHLLSLVLDLTGLGVSLALNVGMGLAGTWDILFFPLTTVCTFLAFYDIACIRATASILRDEDHPA